MSSLSSRTNGTSILPDLRTVKTGYCRVFQQILRLVYILLFLEMYSRIAPSINREMETAEEIAKGNMANIQGKHLLLLVELLVLKKKHHVFLPYMVEM